MALSKIVLDFLGSSDPSEEVLNEKITGIMAENTTLKAENEGLKTDLENEREENGSLKPMAKAGEDYLAELRRKAEADYRLLKGDSVSEDMIKLIKEGDLAQVKTYADEFAKEVESRLPGVCSECGKQAKLIRRSSVESTEGKKSSVDYNDYKTGI